MRYLLNSAVITGPGAYDYRLITAEEAIAWLRQKDFASRIGYPATADYIKSLSGVRPDVNREATSMQLGDEALVVRLKYRVTDPGQKTACQPELDDWEYGILRMIKNSA
ncbi:MAG: hypothetical protein DDT37_01263 [Firmicutes bacterium]|nr:hypothetical protein [candidate division NPL-UPA2 bacterium]